MAYIFVADDFTGASDTLATLARAGLKARLFLDVPDAGKVAGLDAWGIATHARSLGRDGIVALARHVAAGLAAFAPRFLHLKICSTFDSSLETGNVALLARTLADGLGIANIAVIGGQPSLGRHAVFGTLFARGPDGAIHRIDRHPVMSAHPVTPMHEADMLRHLASLGLEGLTLVARGQRGGAFPRYYDALEQADIEAAGRDLLAAGGRCVVMGASSVAEGWLAARSVRGRTTAPPPLADNGPVLAFVGSRSALTTTQVAAAQSFARLPVDPVAMLAGGARCAGIREWAAERLARDENCMIFLTADHAGPFSPAELAEASAAFIAELVATCRPGGLIVAGGDSSSAIIGRLAPASLAHAGTLCPGVPVLRGRAAGVDLPMALKGGQMGGVDFFDRAGAVLRGKTDPSA